MTKISQNNIPYFLIHGFRQFDVFRKPTPNNPFWAGYFENAFMYQQAKGYAGTSKTAGILVMKISQNNVNMFDVINENHMKMFMGNYAKLYVKCAKKGDFGSFYYMWKHIFYYIQKTRINKFIFKDYLIYLLNKYRINESITINPDNIAQKFEILINSIFDVISTHVSDKLTIDYICPTLVQHNFNMIHELEDGFDQWFIISADMLKGKCIQKFNVREEDWEKHLNIDTTEYNIFNPSDLSRILKDLTYVCKLCTTNVNNKS